MLMTPCTEVLHKSEFYKTSLQKMWFYFNETKLFTTA